MQQPAGRARGVLRGSGPARGPAARDLRPHRLRQR